MKRKSWQYINYGGSYELQIQSSNWKAKEKLLYFHWGNGEKYTMGIKFFAEKEALNILQWRFFAVGKPKAPIAFSSKRAVIPALEAIILLAYKKRAIVLHNFAGLFVEVSLLSHDDANTKVNRIKAGKKKLFPCLTQICAGGRNPVEQFYEELISAIKNKNMADIIKWPV